MTKTKKQPRAEAVERLRKLEGKDASYADYCKAMVDCPNGFLGQVAATQIIDLLTDDEPDDGLRYRIIRDGVYMPNVKGCELRSTDIVDGVDEPDSREKLEADVRQRSIRPSTQIDCTYNDVLRWLDRQAAITEAECERICDTCDWPSFAAQPDQEAYDRIAELEAQLADARKALDIAWVERDVWKYAYEDSERMRLKLVEESERANMTRREA